MNEDVTAAPHGGSPALRAQESAVSKAMWWGSMCAHPTISLWVTKDEVEQRCRYVACEYCGGTGEIAVKPNVGPYEDPTPHGELCPVCDGYGMDCVDTDAADEDWIDAEKVSNGLRSDRPRGR